MSQYELLMMDYGMGRTGLHGDALWGFNASQLLDLGKPPDYQGESCWHKNVWAIKELQRKGC